MKIRFVCSVISAVGGNTPDSDVEVSFSPVHGEAKGSVTISMKRSESARFTKGAFYELNFTEVSQADVDQLRAPGPTGLSVPRTNADQPVAPRSPQILQGQPDQPTAPRPPAQPKPTEDEKRTVPLSTAIAQSEANEQRAEARLKAEDAGQAPERGLATENPENQNKEFVQAHEVKDQPGDRATGTTGVSTGDGKAVAPHQPVNTVENTGTQTEGKSESGEQSQRDGQPGNTEKNTSDDKSKVPALKDLD